MKGELMEERKIQDENSLVIYHNELNYVGFGKFTPIELNIFFALIGKMRDSHGREATLSLKELREITGYSQRGDKKMYNDLSRAYKKFWDLSYYKHNEAENEISVIRIFEEFKLNYKEMTLTLSITPSSLYLLDDLWLAGEYTVYELPEFCDLDTSYAKNLYRLLRQFRSTGYLTMTMEDFRKALAVPVKYRNADTVRKVLKPSVEEVSRFIEDLRYDFVRGKGSGRPIERINFYFKKQDRDELRKLTSTERVGKKTSHVCPYCQKFLYERVVNGNVCWLHPDGYHPQARCKTIFNSIDEIVNGKKGEFRAKPIEIEDKSKVEELEKIAFNLFKS